MNEKIGAAWPKLCEEHGVISWSPTGYCFELQWLVKVRKGLCSAVRAPFRSEDNPTVNQVKRVGRRGGLLPDVIFVLNIQYITLCY